MRSGFLKILTIILVVIASLVVLYAIAMVLAPRVLYPEFSRVSEKGVRIPGFSDGFVPQGVSYLSSEGCVLLCGYLGGGKASRIYMVYPDYVKEVRLQRETGEVYSGHAGGISCHGDTVYISNASKVFMLKVDALAACKDKGTVAFTGCFPVECNSSFMSCDGKYLYVGEYHADGYSTKETHRVQSADGVYQALVFAYEIGSHDPVAAYATVDCAQGFCMTPDGKAVISCSEGLKPSYIRVYDVGGPDSSFDYEGRSIPMYVLDSRNQIENLKMPHMSEDLEFHNGKVMVGFESGAKKFGLGLLPCSTMNVMHIPIPTK